MIYACKTIKYIARWRQVGRIYSKYLNLQWLNAAVSFMMARIGDVIINETAENINKSACRQRDLTEPLLRLPYYGR